MRAGLSSTGLSPRQSLSGGWRFLWEGVGPGSSNLPFARNPASPYPYQDLCPRPPLFRRAIPVTEGDVGSQGAKSDDVTM